MNSMKIIFKAIEAAIGVYYDVFCGKMTTSYIEFLINHPLPWTDYGALHAVYQDYSTHFRLLFIRKYGSEAYYHFFEL